MIIDNEKENYIVIDCEGKEYRLFGVSEYGKPCKVYVREND